MNPRLCLPLLVLAISAQAEDPMLRFTLTGHTKTVTALAFSPDGKSLVSAGRDGTIKLWDLATDKTLSATTAEVPCVVFSPDGKTIAATVGKNVMLWDAASGKELATFSGHADTVRSIAFSLDGKTLASADYAQVLLWDVEKRAKIESFKSKSGATAVAFSPDGKMLATELGLRIVLFDLNAGTSRELLDKTPAPRQCKFLTFSADSKTLIQSVRCIPEKIRFWDIASDATTFSLKPEKFDPGEFVYALHFAPERKTLCSASGSGAITLWNTETQTALATYEDPQHFTAAAFTLDGKTLATATADFKIKIFNVETFKPSSAPAKEIEVQF
jgi:WD40 repeat protein